MYYDKYGRVVQTRATNHLLGYDITYNKLDFRGKVTKSQKEHNISGQAVIPEVYRYAYDKAERLILTRYKLGANDTITLAANSYDDLGRLRVKVLGAVDAPVQRRLVALSSAKRLRFVAAKSRPLAGIFRSRKRHEK